MTPNDTPDTLGNIYERVLFVAGTTLIAMGLAFVGCFLLWTTGHMYQDLFSDAESVQAPVESELPACSDNRIEALQAAISTCITGSITEREAPCMEDAQRAICSTPEPEVVPGASVSDRDRPTAKIIRQRRNAYALEMNRSGYSAEQISRSLERYDEMYGSVPFFPPAKR